MTSVFFVALGGAFGATLRYLLSGIINRYFESAFPAGTLGVNLIGCLAVGLLWEPLAQTSLSPHVRTFFLIGVLGAFTTFSTYGIESVNLMRDGEMRLALLNLLPQQRTGHRLLCSWAWALAGWYTVRSSLYKPLVDRGGMRGPTVAAIKQRKREEGPTACKPLLAEKQIQPCTLATATWPIVTKGASNRIRRPLPGTGLCLAWHRQRRPRGDRSGA